jgi:hypothetical protein
MVARSPKATSGPASAPAVSMARCTPKARPRSLPELANEMRASLGAVRTPLPVRSAATTAAIGP